MSAAGPGMQTPLEVAVRADNHVAALRSRIYAQLAAAFRYPSSEDDAGRFSDGSAERELRELLNLFEQLPGDVAVVGRSRRGHAGIGSDGVDALYCSLFEPTSGQARVSLYERDHGRHTREVLWEDLFRCYTHFGLEFDDGGLKEAPDHLVIELEFMHYLTFLEASNPETSRGVALAQGDFLEHHLAVWVPRVCLALEEHSRDSVYHGLAALLRDFVSADRDHLESTIHELRRLP
ncbi:MAG: molecular chaperone TorD family protein [Deltaproteobacteria bacterium]|nr:molecular chaperone TorD family protein [Deltaproteobacteria bacterium]MBW2401756.1 molecular chaperone TorD family protein [Deltaproteobacteria bacterium]